MTSNRSVLNSRAHSAAVGYIAFTLLWFALWTVAANLSVLSGCNFSILPWCFLSTGILAVVTTVFAFPHLRGAYAGPAEVISNELPQFSWRILLVVAAAIGGAVSVQIAKSTVALVASTTVVALLTYLLPKPEKTEETCHKDNLLADGIFILCVLLALYYLGHRPDWDDANYLNLAAKVPLTRGHIFQFDTMVGDGPHPIHLPTYKLQSYELLAATISDLTQLEPIQVLHLLLPFPFLVFAGCLLPLILRPQLGRYWTIAALFSFALMYADSGTFTSWGINGLERFQQGKGILVTIVPLLAAALTARWFILKRGIDLVALTLVHVCAIGLSANGLFVSPLASCAVALAFLCTNPRRYLARALGLIPTVFYPAAMSAVIVARHMALPSEVLVAQSPYSSFRGVAGWHAEGLALIALMPMLPLVARSVDGKRAAAAYLPIFFALLLNSVGWRVASELTGNLSFRTLWAIPGPFLAGAVAVRLVQFISPVFGRAVGFVLGSAALATGVLFNQITASSDERIEWHLPGLRVPKKDYEIAESLARATPPGCKALVPERYAVWMSGLRNGPYLVAVRSLYLVHYRFTEPAPELFSRRVLFGLVNRGANEQALPPLSELRSDDFRIGLIAVPTNVNQARVEAFAKSLQLRRLSFRTGPLTVWQGGCALTTRG